MFVIHFYLHCYQFSLSTCIILISSLLILLHYLLLIILKIDIFNISCNDSSLHFFYLSQYCYIVNNATACDIGFIGKRRKIIKDMRIKPLFSPFTLASNIASSLYCIIVLFLICFNLEVAFQSIVLRLSVNNNYCSQLNNNSNYIAQENSNFNVIFAYFILFWYTLYLQMLIPVLCCMHAFNH